jgi:hypothetical protein
VSEWRGNQKWTIQSNWQHRAHKTKKSKIHEILSPVFTMLNHINKLRHTSYVDMHIIKNKVNISQTKITLAKFASYDYVL